ncbi:hypothetical protein [Desulfosporosinus shakirovi]|uniref:hypothetical protein n=1 Tax=Desulfosporosinus shakirovi TaxID=2885154 RepID=UPI001E45F0A6|nr:hypothetical protein [Desulfosporosinus sp. SRJS8]MCB8815168.1 hypothetical protein [Desulfosporosinus sp. SRJS8]
MNCGPGVNKKEQVRPDQISTTAEELPNEGPGNAVNSNYTNDFKVKVKKEIEANNLRYNCETGFHYMEQ